MHENRNDITFTSINMLEIHKMKERSVRYMEKSRWPTNLSQKYIYWPILKINSEIKKTKGQLTLAEVNH